MGKLFGTDGIRGEANRHPMTADLALTLGKALTLQLASVHARPRIVIGKDTRLSGYTLENALVAGICAAGGEAMLVGPLPTPGVAFVTRSLRALAGVVISASHNPFRDNGIKIFTGDGTKIPDEQEAALEALLTGAAPMPELPEGDRLGKAYRVSDAAGRYVEYVKGTYPRNLTLEGIRIVVDCANGAAYQVAPKIFRELGAEVTVINDHPDGTNINLDCGATDPRHLAQTVLATGADVGLALDGDGDRAVLVDRDGTLVDGDQILAICAARRIAAGTLPGKTVVATVMSNKALEDFIEARGGRLVRSRVGDRFVAEAMREGGFTLGGEQSGHIIFGDYAFTGDGLVTALQVLEAVTSGSTAFGSLSTVISPYPQILVNIPLRKTGGALDPALEREVKRWEGMLGGHGRILIRPSGTEPLLRIMVEGPDEALTRQAAEDLAAAAGGDR
jgi:phosphoglucosamine mutase